MPHVFFAFGRRQKGESVLVSGDRNPFFFADSDCDSIGDNTFLSSFTQEEGYIAMGTRCITCLSESPERTRLLGELLSGFVEKALCILSDCDDDTTDANVLFGLYCIYGESGQELG